MRVLAWMSLATAVCALTPAAPSADQPGGTVERYQMRQKLISFGDDYWIENH